MIYRKAFTLKELIVVLVVLIIVALFFVIYPASTRIAELRNRVSCASSLRSIGNAVAMYQNDYDKKNPIPWSDKVTKAGFGTGWYNTKGANTYTRCLDTTWKDWDKQPTVGGCLYLLVKYEDIKPDRFICPSAIHDDFMDINETVIIYNINVEDWTDLNDFQSGCNLSYSMNDPWENPLDASSRDASSPEDMPFLADKSNKFDTETFSERPHTGNSPNYKITGFWTDQGDKEGSDEGHGNSNNHNTECQNVLFAGNHVERFETPTVGIDGDNIYTRWDESVSPIDKKIGKWGKGLFSADKNDAYLGN